MHTDYATLHWTNIKRIIYGFGWYTIIGLIKSYKLTEVSIILLSCLKWFISSWYCIVDLQMIWFWLLTRLILSRDQRKNTCPELSGSYYPLQCNKGIANLLPSYAWFSDKLIVFRTINSILCNKTFFRMGVKKAVGLLFKYR